MKKKMQVSRFSWKHTKKKLPNIHCPA